MKTDLDKLLPEDDVIEFTAKNGQRYEIALFVPFAVGAFILENAEAIAEVFPVSGSRPKISAKTADIVLKLLAMICREQHPHMDEAWIKKNISLPRLIIIILQIATPVYRYVTSMGLLEAALPGKEPETH